MCAGGGGGGGGGERERERERERESELGDNNIRELLNMKFVCMLCYEFLHHPLEILGISKGNNCVKRHNL